jgi:hypothetical protein
VHLCHRKINQKLFPSAFIHVDFFYTLNVDAEVIVVSYKFITLQRKIKGAN